jgi:hypothetical protein
MSPRPSPLVGTGGDAIRVIPFVRIGRGRPLPDPRERFLWDAEVYERNARFVSDLGMAVVALLDPAAREVPQLSSPGFSALLPTVVNLQQLTIVAFLEIVAAIIVLLPLVLGSYVLLTVRALRAFKSRRAVRAVNRGTVRRWPVPQSESRRRRT